MDEILASLALEGYLSDDRFADTYARSRANRGFGPLRIRQELRQRGVEPGNNLGVTDWNALIETVYIKKYGTTLPASLPEQAARQRFLAQRGFGHDDIAALFRRLKDDHR